MINHPRRLPFALVGVFVAAGALSGCGMPGQSAPAQATQVVEAAPELLGGVEGTSAQASEVSQAMINPEPARRAGWGTMAPIPNPDEEGTRLAAAESRSAPYRVIGPAVPERQIARRPSDRARLATLQPQPATKVNASAVPPRPVRAAGPRIRHWIIPIADRR